MTHNVRTITEGQQRWLERIAATFGTPFSEDAYAVAPDGIARMFLNGLVFVCTRDSRCHLEIQQTGGGPPSDFKDLMIWRDEHGLDGSYDATYDAIVGDH